MKDNRLQDSARAWPARQMLCVLLALLMGAGDTFAWQSAPLPPAASEGQPAAKASGGGDRTQWDRLKTLRPGETIWIDYMNGEQLKHAKGEMVAWNEEGLTVRLKKSETVITRKDAQKVAVYGGKNHASGAGVGALIGLLPALLFGVGGAAGGAGGSEGKNFALAFAVTAGIFTAIGGAIGRTRKATLYQAPKTGR
jgi:hypothetical protein